MNLEFDTCKKYKINAKLMVVFPLAEVFNETIAMDLKHWSDDTQYSVSYVVRSYYILLHHIRYHILSKVILQKISIHWVYTLAVQRQFWLTVGAYCIWQFHNIYRKQCYNLHYNSWKSLEQEAHWKHNDVSSLTVTNTLKDTHCDLETAFVWAISPKIH